MAMPWQILVCLAQFSTRCTTLSLKNTLRKWSVCVRETIVTHLEQIDVWWLIVLFRCEDIAKVYTLRGRSKGSLEGARLTLRQSHESKCLDGRCLSALLEIYIYTRLSQGLDVYSINLPATDYSTNCMALQV